MLQETKKLLDTAEESIRKRGWVPHWDMLAHIKKLDRTLLKLAKGDVEKAQAAFAKHGPPKAGEDD